MDSIILLFLCMILGVALQRAKAFPANSHTVLNQFVIYISLPAMALFYIPKIEISTKLLFPIGVAWIGFLLAYLFFAGLGKYFGWSKKLIGCLVLTAGLGNTSFVGFPVIEALYGKKGLETAIVVDQPGTFVVMATFGIIVASFYSRGTPNPKAIVSKILFFPPFIAFFLAVMMNVFHFDFSDDLQLVFQRLGNTVTPIALVAVGLQLKFDRRSRHYNFLALGLFFKLILTPLFFFIFYKLILKGDGMEVDVSILESAMAPMITAAILASSHGLKPKLSSMMIGFGIPISFITLGIWYLILMNF